MRRASNATCVCITWNCFALLLFFFFAVFVQFSCCEHVWVVVQSYLAFGPQIFCAHIQFTTDQKNVNKTREWERAQKRAAFVWNHRCGIFLDIYINALSILNPYYIRSGSTIHFAVVLCVSASAAVVDMVDVSAWLCNYASLCIMNFHSFYFFVIFVFSVHLLFLLVIFVLIQCTSTFFVVVSLIYICSSSTLKREGITGVDDGRFKSRTVYSLFSFLQFYGVVWKCDRVQWLDKDKNKHLAP